MVIVTRWKHQARKRRALELLKQHRKPTEVARTTGLAYSTVWRLHQPILQQQRTVEVHQDSAPDRLWAGDLYTCPACGHGVVTGFGSRPIAEDGQPSYAQQRERLGPIYPGRTDVNRGTCAKSSETNIRLVTNISGSKHA
jgi:hypothetical protein